ncbi:hypothetical protein PIB30_081910 [Stylosanthes scabra]|uniref:Uncharacterized protein n=1 Tax=Stylosanthes scabra TaxID=79078 RepID=A0ABU6UTK8_9FABA|nr:hypothetical protein [Stylosanthes scabra]
MFLPIAILIRPRKIISRWPDSTVSRSEFTVDRPKFTVHRSEFTIDRPKFTVHRSEFTVPWPEFVVSRTATFQKLNGIVFRRLYHGQSILRWFFGYRFLLPLPKPATHSPLFSDRRTPLLLRRSL